MWRLMAKDECIAEEIKSCVRGSHTLFEISNTLSFNKRLLRGIRSGMDSGLLLSSA